MLRGIDIIHHKYEEAESEQWFSHYVGNIGILINVMLTVGSMDGKMGFCFACKNNFYNENALRKHCNENIRHVVKAFLHHMVRIN